MAGPLPYLPRRCLVSLLIAVALSLFASRGAEAYGVCTQPVPRVAIALLNQAVSAPHTRAAVVQTINYLTRQYCIEYGTLPPIDYTESIGNKCIMYSGTLAGERVYWADCPNDAQPFTLPPPPAPPPPPPPAPPPPPQVDFWSLDDGSRLTLRANPNATPRTFIFEAPSPARVAEGVSRGSVLFDGHRLPGFRYSGKAFAFQSGCPPLAYDVTGVVSENQRQVTLQGRMPVRNSSCRQTGSTIPVTMILTFHNAHDGWGTK